MGDEHGALRQHYDEEFMKYTELLNQGTTTKRVMFWAVKYPEKRIDTEHIANELGLTLDEVGELTLSSYSGASHAKNRNAFSVWYPNLRAKLAEAGFSLSQFQYVRYPRCSHSRMRCAQQSMA